MMRNGVAAKPSAKDYVKLGMLVGSGTYGMVYRSEWQGQRVAVKVLPHSIIRYQDVAQEFEIMVNVIHENIVRSLHMVTWYYTPSTPNSAGDIGTEAQTFIIQEYCDTGTLGNYLMESTIPVSAHNLQSYLLDIANGMAFLHSQNILHGDLTLNNVMLHKIRGTDRHIAKIVDFGLGRILNQGQTHDETRSCGTITHMPPELFNLGHISKAADVYAFAIMVWIAWNRQKPFQGHHYTNVIRMVCDGVRPPLESGVPPDWSTLMESCWNGDRHMRPTFAQIAKSIEHIIAISLPTQHHVIHPG